MAGEQDLNAVTEQDKVRPGHYWAQRSLGGWSMVLVAASRSPSDLWVMVFGGLRSAPLAEWVRSDSVIRMRRIEEPEAT